MPWHSIVVRAALAACTLTTIGCKVAQPASDPSAILYHDGFSSPRWPSTSINVCWEPEGSRFAEEKKVVEEIVTREYRRAGLEITGWRTCSVVSGGIRILLSDAYDRGWTMALGKQVSGMKNGMIISIPKDNPKVRTVCQTSPQHKIGCYATTAVHEFGHALGFIHEHYHAGSTCDIGGDQADEKAKKASILYSTSLGRYDELSIMNYCANGAYMGRGEAQPLSEEDIRSIRALYESSPLATGSEVLEKYNELKSEGSGDLTPASDDRGDDHESFAESEDDSSFDDAEDSRFATREEGFGRSDVNSSARSDGDSLASGNPSDFPASDSRPPSSKTCQAGYKYYPATGFCYLDGLTPANFGCSGDTVLASDGQCYAATSVPSGLRIINHGI